MDGLLHARRLWLIKQCTTLWAAQHVVWVKRRDGRTQQRQQRWSPEASRPFSTAPGKRYCATGATQRHRDGVVTREGVPGMA